MISVSLCLLPLHMSDSSLIIFSFLVLGKSLQLIALHVQGVFADKIEELEEQEDQDWTQFLGCRPWRVHRGQTLIQEVLWQGMLLAFGFNPCFVLQGLDIPYPAQNASSALEDGNRRWSQARWTLLLRLHCSNSKGLLLAGLGMPQWACN